MIRRGRESTGYGKRRSYNGQYFEGYYHRGVDYAEDVGTSVASPAEGVVKLVGFEEGGFSVHVRRPLNPSMALLAAQCSGGAEDRTHLYAWPSPRGEVSGLAARVVPTRPAGCHHFLLVTGQMARAHRATAWVWTTVTAW